MATRRRRKQLPRKRKTSGKKTILLVVVLSLIVVAGATAFLAKRWQRRDPAFYVAKAVEACRAGEMLAAMGAYGGAYSDTLDPRWIVEQGRVAKAFGDASRALASFDKAISARAQYLPAHNERVELRLELVRFSPDAKSHANLLQDAEALLSLDPENARAHLAKGIGLAGLVLEDSNYADQSLAAMRRANELAPDDVEIADALARRLAGMRQAQETDEPVRRSQSDPVEEVYTKVITAAPDNAEARLRFAEFRMRRLQDEMRQAAARGLRFSDREKTAYLEDIRSLLDKAAELGAGGADAALAEATYWSIAGKPRKGVDLLGEAIEQTPDDLRLYVELGQRLLESSQFARAREALQRGLDQPFDRESYRGLLDRPRRHRMWCILGQTCLAMAEAEPAQRDDLITKAEQAHEQADIEMGPDHWRGRLLLGQILWARQLPIPAIARYYEADRMLSWHSAPDHALHVKLILMRALVDQDLFGPASDLLDDVLEHRPGDPRALALRAEGELKMGHTHNAAANAAHAVRSLLPQARTSPDAAAADETDLDAKARKLVRIWWIAARLEAEAADAAQAESMLGAPTATDWLALGNVAEFIARDSDDDKLLEEAGRAYTKALNADPSEVEAARRLASLYISPERRAGLIEILDRTLEQLDAHTKQGHAVRLAEARARLKALRAQVEPSLNEQQRLTRVMQAFAELPASPKRARLVARYALRTDQADTAVKTLKRACEADPDNVPLLEHLFEAALQAEDWSLARQLADGRMAELNVDGASGRICEGRVGLARALAAQAETSRHDALSPEKLQKLQDLANEQLELAKQSLRIGAEEVRWYDQPRVWLSRALEALGEDEAKDAYLMALMINPLNGQAHAGLARLAEKTRVSGEEASGHLHKAICLARRGPDGLPIDPWLRDQARDRYEEEHPAESLVRREAMRSRRPDDAENLLRLGMLYRRQGEADKAEEALNEALSKAPKNIAIHAKVADVVRTDQGFEPAVKILEQLAGRLEGRLKSDALLLFGRMIRDELERREAGGSPATALRPLRDRADAVFEQAAQAHLTPDVCRAAADFCMMTGRRQEAVDWLKRALRSRQGRLDEKSIMERIIRTTLAIRPVPEEAERLVLDYDKRYQGYVEVSLFWGLLHAARGDLDTALTEHSRYIMRLTGQQQSAYGKPGQLPEAYRLRGKLYTRLAAVRPDQRDRYLRLAIEDLQRAKAYAAPSEYVEDYVTDLARAYERAGDRDEAVRELRGALRKRPNNAELALELIEMLGRQGNFAEQEAVIRKQKNLQPKHWRWAYLLGQAAERRGNVPEADRAYGLAARLCEYGRDGVGTEAVVQWVRLVARRRDPKEVISAVEANVRPGDRDYRVWTYYGAAKLQAGRTREALGAWVAACKACFGSLEQGKISRAITRMLGKDKALALVTQMADANPDNAHVQLLRAVMLYQMQQRADAIRALEAMRGDVEDQDELVALLGYLGTLYALSGEGEKAKAIFKEALELDKDDLTSLNNMAYVLSEQDERPEDALVYAQRAVEVAPDTPDVLDTLGWCLALSGKPEAGLAVLEEAQNRGPMVSIYLHRAEVCRKLGRMDEARRLVREGLELARKNPTDPYVEAIQKLARDLEG